MLTFFRRIRKGLLKGGHTSKYILYAIGEIALVVIGILIALQINNWNEGRKDRLKEHDILGMLIEELNANKSHIEDNMDWHTEIKKTALTLLTQCYQDKSEEAHTEIDKLIGDLCFFLSVGEIEIAVVDAIVSSGELAVIQSDNLRKEITSWRKKVTVLGKMVEQDYDHFSNDWMPYIRSNTNVSQLSNAIETIPGSQDSIFESSLQKPPVRIDHEAILQDQEFQNLIAHKVWIQEDILNNYEQLVLSVNLLTDLIGAQKK